MIRDAIQNALARTTVLALWAGAFMFGPGMPEVLAAQSTIGARVETERSSQSVEIRTGVDAVERPDDQTIPSVIEAPVDDRGVWFHVHRGSLEAAERELARLQIENPGWQPSDDLMKAVKDLQTGQVEVSRPVVDRASVAARAEARTFARDLAALGKLGPEDASEVSLGQLERFARAVSKRRDGGAAVLLGWLYVHRNDLNTARDWFEKARGWGKPFEAAEGLSQVLLIEATEAALAGNPDMAIEKLRIRAALGFTEGAESVGWRLLDTEQPEFAERLFAEAGPVEGAIYGRTLALRRLGRLSDATELACSSVAISSRIANSCGDLLVEAMVEASESSQYDRVLALADQLEVLGISRLDAYTMIAWARLRTGDSEVAAREFESILDQPSVEPKARESAAIGLVESLTRSGQKDRLEKLASSHDEIARILQQITKRQAFDRKQFDLAARMDPQNVTLNDRMGWAADVSQDFKRSAGDAGQGRLLNSSTRVGVHGMAGEYRVGLRISSSYQRTGVAAKTADIGFRFAAPDQFPTTASDRVTDMSLHARLERPDYVIFGQLGLGAMGGVVPQRTVGQVGATIFKDNQSLTGRLFYLPITTSLLASSGMRDPVTGEGWGGVVDGGVSALGVWSSDAGVSLSVNAELARVSGRHVPTNDRKAVRGNLTVDLDRQGFDYFRVGPFLAWSAYDQNLSHYTFGHGGYFSPQQDVRGGVSFDVISDEGQMRQFQARGSVSYGSVTEDAAPRFPGQAQDGPDYAASVKRGLSGDVTMQWAEIVSDRLIFGAFAGIASAPEYDYAFVGLTLRYSLEPRSGLFSADLPLSSFRQ